MRAADRGVSTILGIALVAALVIATAAIVGAFLAADPPVPQSNDAVAVFDVDYDPGDGSTNASITFTHAGGDPLYGGRVFVEDDANTSRVSWRAIHPSNRSAVDGVSITLDGRSPGGDEPLSDVCAQSEGYEYRLVRYTENGERRVLRTVRLPSEPAGCV
jgi:FlaG/FlaF family flagellin (archaellin)